MPPRAIILLLSLLCAACYPSFALADFSRAAWPLMKQVVGLPALAESGYVMVPVDTELESMTATSRFGDLRVIADNGEEVASAVIADGAFGGVILRSATITERREDITRSGTVLFAEFEGLGPITESLELIPLSSANFLRRMVVETSVDGRSWIPIVDRTISQIDTDGRTERSLSATYPATRTKYIRVTIFNEDNRPIPFAPELRFTSPRRAIIFEASPGETYIAYFGNSLATAPTYDIASILPMVRTSSLPRGTLGPVEKNPDFMKEQASSRLDGKETLLNILFLALTVLLFLSLVFVLRNMIRKKAMRW